MVVNTDAPATPVIPHCPHCNSEMPALGLFNWQAGAYIILSLFCSTCKKVLHLQVVPVMPDESRVHLPS
jgi:hypothetical protein